MKHFIRISIFSLIIIILSACTDKNKFSKETSAFIASFPVISFAVLSDLHYYDKTLGIVGNVFLDYLDNDRKLLVQSEEILDTAIKEIIEEKVKFVIIPGDLTKDGEKINHMKISEKLHQFTDAGINVYVINGNHDILNGHSFKYFDNKKEKVESITKDEFALLYREFGYDKAIDRDKSSLSYLTEPVKGLWLIALDSCMWQKNDNNKEPLVDGKIKPETLQWVENILKRANSEHKSVVAFMHHGLLEHYKANKRYYGEYVVHNNEKIAELFCNYNLNFVFTGHFHSQDITVKNYKHNKFMYDIETGSLVTHPCPYRIVNITNDNKMMIYTKNISNILSIKSFKDYSYQYVKEGTIKMASKKLKKYRVPDKDISIIANQISSAYIAHLSGDENPPTTTIDTQNIGLWSKIILLFQNDLVNGWWNDLTPNDNKLIINLENGKYD